MKYLIWALKFGIFLSLHYATGFLVSPFHIYLLSCLVLDPTYYSYTCILLAKLLYGFHVDGAAVTCYNVAGAVCLTHGVSYGVFYLEHLCLQTGLIAYDSNLMHINSFFEGTYPFAIPPELFFQAIERGEQPFITDYRTWSEIFGTKEYSSRAQMHAAWLDMLEKRSGKIRK